MATLILMGRPLLLFKEISFEISYNYKTGERIALKLKHFPVGLRKSKFKSRPSTNFLCSCHLFEYPYLNCRMRNNEASWLPSYSVWNTEPTLEILIQSLVRHISNVLGIWSLYYADDGRCLGKIEKLHAKSMLEMYLLFCIPKQLWSVHT